MRDDNLIATTNYQDFRGTVSADSSDQKHIRELAKKFGVDLYTYYIIGINIYFGEFGDIDKRIHVDFLAVDVKATGVGDNDSIQEYINNHDETLPYVKLSFTNIGFIEILDYFKRFDIVLTYKNINAKKYQLTQ